MSKNLQMQKKPVYRGDELALTNPVDGLYVQDLLPCNNDDSIVALGLSGTEHPIFNILNKSATNLYKKTETFLNYIAPNGTAAGSPTAPTITDRCEPGNTVENGFIYWECEGFTTHRRSTKVRDITDRNIRLCDEVPVYDIYGNRIEDDFQWDVFRLGVAMMQDKHRWLMNGNSANPGETDGILAQIDYGYIDPVLAQPIPQMDSFVVDWNGNPVCDFEAGATGVTINGVAVPAPVLANFTLIDMIKSYVVRVAQRISMTSIAGSFNYVALIDPQLLRCLIDCYVCYTVCGSNANLTNFRDSEGARTELERLRAILGRFGSVQLSFDGYNVTFIPWTWGGLYDDVTDTFSIAFLVPRIGNYPVWELEHKDMQAAIRGSGSNVLLDYKEWMVSDGGQFLHWSQIDHTCWQRHMESQMRLCNRAPWTAMVVRNITCTDVLGRISHDPLDDRYYGVATPGESPYLAAQAAQVPFVLR